ncbi:Inositol 1,4,5-trisphosphate receptor type 3, partial [Lamellibrachia satsuma]
LRSWLSSFLSANMDMTASLIGHNTLVEQVLRLVHCLVSFGYYGDMDDMKQLLTPLLSLLDGRNDKLYPEAAGVPVMQAVRDHYRAEARFQQSPETKAIVDAKYQAMRVMDLFLNFQFNTRLERFIQEFKMTYVEAHHSVISHPELGSLLNETFVIEEDMSTNKAALKRMAELFHESDYFGSYHLNDILLDLSHYNYDMMIVKSMALLNRFYSTHDNLFTHAVQAQMLITDASMEVRNDLQQMLPEMHRLTSSKMSEEQMKKMSEYLDKLIRYCSLEDEPGERHAMNQSILYNHRILSIVFDILSQEIDIKLKEQYRGMQEIFRKCFSFLKAMARENVLVQQRLFDRLDLLLNIQGAESEMAEALIEVFTNNKQTCLKVMPHHIQKIMSLVATHTNKAPQFLDLLNAIVKVEELNLPLKRNQAYVMKYFMQYRTEVAYVIDQPKEQRLALLKGPDCADLNYLVSVVDLLATCAEGENRFIESICQTIFSLDELLDILNDSAVCNNIKKPYVRFLLWVYLNTASGMVESGAGDLPHSGAMWRYLNSLNALLADLSKYTEASPETVKQLLKKSPGKASDFFNNLLEDPDRLNTILRC